MTLTKLCMSNAHKSRIHTSITTWAGKVPTDLSLVGYAKDNTQKFEARQKQMKDEGASNDIIREELGHPGIHTFNGILKYGLEKLEGTDRTQLEEAMKAWPEAKPVLEIVVDRFVIRDGVESRMADSIETALSICGTEARAALLEPGADLWRDLSFQTSYRNPKTGFVLDELSPRHFSFNSPLGACETCEGLGT